MRIGLDIGSTTIKAVALNHSGQIIYKSYARHYARIAQRAAALLREILQKTQCRDEVSLALSGSAGMGLAQACGIAFVQEVYATHLAADRLMPGADVVIELGGEDAKILFLSGSGGLEVRMNGSCAGGTGAFIDQMAALLRVTPGEMDEMAARHSSTYTIASRCGVFAKSDIQPLVNQGARKEDIAKSIFGAVVNQTIAGLAQGRRIEGRVTYLGGPLTFFSELRASFDQALGLQGVCPENALYYVAYGAALERQEPVSLQAVIGRIEGLRAGNGYAACPPLFASQAEYEDFVARHARGQVACAPRPGYAGGVCIGIDAGSTTVKAVAVDEDGGILMSSYLSNGGDPVEPVRGFLRDFYRAYPQAKVKGAYSTGYGEQLIHHAFRLDGSVVETIAHYTAAAHMRPEVDFIIDIGGQDIKCFRIVGGVIDDIFLNEACSSGCGSFLQALAATWDMTPEAFARRGLLAEHPVDLGSRCTVFMNSSVKQAQKDGASMEDISAGLSISVVKNALYKVIRSADAKRLGQCVVVQGGTFLSDAVLRAFEQEIGQEVFRPVIAGLMGAYGAALSACREGRSTILGPEELERLNQTRQVSACRGCENHCLLTISRFDGGRVCVSGNRCERMSEGAKANPGYNLYAQKRKWLAECKGVPGTRGRLGIPMVLNLYEMLPFWHAIFTELGFEVVVSPPSTRALYLSGQHTIPSDTVCYPAKLAHGHVKWLLNAGVDAVFYPCLSYNFDEGKGDNHFNCPVVAYYPELLRANMPELKGVPFLADYLGIHRAKGFPRKLLAALRPIAPDLTLGAVRRAAHAGYAAHAAYRAKVREQGLEALRRSRAQGRQVIILAGRPYHMDQEVCHGIDQLVAGMGVTVISEDAVCGEVEKVATGVLNQWTYHGRLYSAARYVARLNDPGVNLVQLVSFGCGLDAVTTDEVRSILSDAGRPYTQIKMDEITNLGAVKIRLRSLFAALERRNDG